MSSNALLDKATLTRKQITALQQLSAAGMPEEASLVDRRHLRQQSAAAGLVAAAPCNGPTCTGVYARRGASLTVGAVGSSLTWGSG